MQGKIIADQIVFDAKAQAKKIAEKTQILVDDLRTKYLDYVAMQTEALNKKLKDAEDSLEQSYASNFKIEKTKIVYKVKQEILFCLKQKALDEMLAFDKKKKLKFVDTLIKYNAEKGETLYINYPGLSLIDIKNMSITKKLSLKVLKGSDIGLILSSDKMDKNLLFSSLINSAYEKHEKEISDLIF